VTEKLLRGMVDDARLHGAEVVLDGLRDGEASMTLITGATPDLMCMQTSVFAPVLSVMRAANAEEARAANEACAYGLSASVFGPEDAAREFARGLRVGHVLINDVVIPSADPRVSFGGRGKSGYGVTRGVDGLLAMTTPRMVQVSRGSREWAWVPTGDGHVEFFAGLAALLHGAGLKARVDGLKRVVRAARKLK
jgi:aldehyde dehydrogenase (NAD+)